jgi:hypothetical protein
MVQKIHAELYQQEQTPIEQHCVARRLTQLATAFLSAVVGGE